MKSTLTVLRLVGTPFAPNLEFDFNNPSELQHAYIHALKNKIGLLYLENLKNKNNLPNELIPKLEAEKEKLNQGLITMKRAASALNKAKVNYVVYKTLMPFPATLNDVDILVMGAQYEYGKACKTLIRTGFKLIASAPLEILFHDERICKHKVLAEKDPFDVDLYSEIGASHLISLDKRKILPFKKKITLLGENVQIFTPEADLLTTLVHSIYPEQLYTLQHYYATLYYLQMMDNKALTRFLNIIVDNHAVIPIRRTLGLAAAIHIKAHGYIPERLTELMEKFHIKTDVLNSDFKIPLHFTILDVILMISNKIMEKHIAKSLCIQSIYMLKPTLTNHMITQMVYRSRRETY